MSRKNKYFIALFTLISSTLSAQTPNAVDDCRKAVFAIQTYDENGAPKSTGRGFYIDEEGTALTDYDLLKGAKKAEITDVNGKKYPISTILGANEMFNVVKFQVAEAKKISPLKFAAQPATKGTKVYVVRYTTNKFAICDAGMVDTVSHFSDDKFPYYTLSVAENERDFSCPVVNERGEVLAMVQKSSDKDVKKLFGISINYCNLLKINALSADSRTMKAIGIPKALPNTEEQALVYLYMKSNSQNKEDYMDCLNQFIGKYPKNVDGYLYRAQAFANKDQFSLAENDINTALKIADKKDNVHYNFGKLIYQIALFKPKANYKDWTLDKALSEAEVAYALNPLPIYTLQQADVLYAQQKYAEAYAKYMEVCQSNLKSAQSFSFAAQAKKMAGGSTDEVLALQDSAVAQCPQPYTREAAPYLLARAQTRVETQKYRDAVADYNEYERLMPNALNAQFYYLRERAEINGRLFQQALNDMERAVQLGPHESLYHAEQASLFYRVGKTAEAIPAARKAIELDPNFADAYRILGVCLIDGGQKDEGLQQLQKAKELGDENAEELIQKFR